MKIIPEGPILSLKGLWLPLSKEEWLRIWPQRGEEGRLYVRPLRLFGEREVSWGFVFWMEGRLSFRRGGKFFREDSELFDHKAVGIVRRAVNRDNLTG